MRQALVVAEADQIQDLIFRASRLRQVVGGSQLLTRFCSQGAVELLRRFPMESGAEVIVNDGGSFRIEIHGETDGEAISSARSYGAALAELYRTCTGGHLTVAEPQPLANDFTDAVRRAESSLREAKRRGGTPATTAHLPYAAFCASCGVTVACSYEKRHDDDPENYICSHCLIKENEYFAEKKRLEKGSREGFLGRFQTAVELAATDQALPELDIPALFPEDAGEVGSLDARRYVAYLLADGNGMGTWFSRCTKGQMKSLSLALPDVLRSSLAATCPRLLERILERRAATNPSLARGEKGLKTLPVLPLILGGDDMMALVPARWALHLAAMFCREFENRMMETLGGLVLATATARTPTISAAVVICKESYPHTLARRRGETLLKHGKMISKRLELRGERRSLVAFDVLTGSPADPDALPESGTWRPHAGPYFAADIASDNQGLSMERLLEQRLRLKDLPGKRRAELESHYDMNLRRVLRRPAGMSEWRQDLKEILDRIDDYNLRDAMSALGSDDPDRGYWRLISRPGERDVNVHGLPDLFRAWDYSYRLDKQESEYRELQGN